MNQMQTGWRDARSRAWEPPVGKNGVSRYQEWQDKVESWIKANPAASLAIAVSIGILVGWWSKRR